MTLKTIFEHAKDQFDILCATHGFKDIDNLPDHTLGKMSQEEFNQASQATVERRLNSVTASERPIYKSTKAFQSMLAELDMKYVRTHAGAQAGQNPA